MKKINLHDPRSPVEPMEAAFLTCIEIDSMDLFINVTRNSFVIFKHDAQYKNDAN
jgi:hypothetical protein